MVLSSFYCCLAFLCYCVQSFAVDFCCQCKWLPGKTRIQNDLYCVKREPSAAYCCCVMKVLCWRRIRRKKMQKMKYHWRISLNERYSAVHSCLCVVCTLWAIRSIQLSVVVCTVFSCTEIQPLYGKDMDKSLMSSLTHSVLWWSTTLFLDCACLVVINGSVTGLMWDTVSCASPTVHHISHWSVVKVTSKGLATIYMSHVIRSTPLSTGGWVYLLIMQ